MVVRCTRACLGLARSQHPRLVLALFRVVYRKYASMRHQHNCNAWGSKSGKMQLQHNHAQPIHVNLYKLFTNLPLSFLVF
jgi:hypothetical protein